MVIDSKHKKHSADFNKRRGPGLHPKRLYGGDRHREYVFLRSGPAVVAHSRDYGGQAFELRFIHF